MTGRTHGSGRRRDRPDRLLPVLVAAMVFLAELATAGATVTTLLTDRWRDGADLVATIQVPAAATGSLDAVTALLRGNARFAGIERLDPARLSELLGHWLRQPGQAVDGADALPLPTVFLLRLRPGTHLPPELEGQLRAVAPGTTVEATAARTERLLALTHGLRLGAILTSLVVGLIAIGLVAAGTRANVERRYPALEIMHDLGADAGFIAGRCARRTIRLVLGGSAAGIVLVLPLLLLLCRLAVPFAAGGAAPYHPAFPAPRDLYEAARSVPAPVWLGLPLPPLVAVLVGWGTAQVAVRTWLRRLP